MTDGFGAQGPAGDDGPQPAAGHPGRRLTVLLGIQDHVGRRSLMVSLVERARRLGMAGATVVQANSGFGASGALHESHLLRDDGPVSFTVVDAPERIDAFAAAAADLLDEDVVVLTEEVTILQGPFVNRR